MLTPAHAASTPKQGSPAAPSTAEPEVTVLPNGLNVLTLKDTRFPLVSVRLYVRTGSAYEDPKQAGISHLLEHMVFKGTTKREPGQVAADVEKVGGYLNAATSFDYTVYYVDVPAKDFRLAMDIVQDMTFGARIDPAELESEKKVVISELERGEDNPGQLLFKMLQSQVWPGSTYARPIIGMRDTVNAITRQDILDYIAQHYQPKSMLLAVVGDIDQATVLASAKEAFGSLTNSQPTSPARPLTLSGQGPTVEVRRGQWNKAYMAMAFPLPGLHSSEAAGLDVLAHLLGGDKTARWYDRFKYKERLVDDISVSSMTLERGGLLYVSASLDPANVDTFWKKLLADMATLSAKDFSEQELSRAKLNIEDGLFTAKETLSGLASKVGYFQFFEGGQQAEANYLHTLQHVEAGELNSLISQYLRPEKLSAAVLLPDAKSAGAKAASPADGTPANPKDAPVAAPADTARLLELTRQTWPTSQQKKVQAQAQSGTAQSIQVGNIKVVFQPDTTLPYTALSMVWPGGDGLLAQGEDGLAEITARMLTKGTSTRTAQELQTFLSDRAASLDVSAGRDTFALNAKYPTRFESDMLSLVREMLLAPGWRPDELDRAQQEQRAAIKSREDEPIGLAFRYAFPFLFSNTGLGALHLGKPEDLGGFDAARMTTFWTRQFGQPMVLSVCGTFDRATVVELAQQLDKSRKASSGFVFETPHWKSDRTLELKLPGRNQSHLLRIFPVAGLESPDAPGLELLRAALAGQSGILFRDLRDRQGLGYSVTAFLWQAPKAGFMAFYIGTEPGKREQALTGFDKAIADLRANPLPEEEASRARNLLVGDYYRENQSLLARSRDAASNLARGLPQGYSRAQVDAAQKLTPKDIQELARKYLKPEASYLITVEP